MTSGSRAATAPPPRRRGRDRPTREAIVEAAFALIEREGLDAFSMRRLAAAVDLPTTTLYGYFADKDEIVDAVIDAEATRSPLPELTGPWRRQLGDLMRWLREGVARHPDLVKVRLARPILSPGALRLTEAGMQVLLAAGFSRAEAAEAYRALFVFSFGWGALHPRQHSEDDTRRTLAALTLLPPEEYPALSSSIQEAAAATGGDEPFEYGLEPLLDGLEASLRRAPSPA